MRRFLALLMVVSLVGASAFAAPASAATWGQDTGDCDELDEFLWTLSIGLLNEQCDSSELSAQNQELEEDLANSTEVNIYNTGKTADTTSEQFLTVMGNSVGDSRTIAMSKAEAAAIEAIDNGATETEAQTAAREAVNDFYTVKQMNLVDRWNNHLQVVDTMRNASTTSGVNNVQVDETWDDGSNSYNYLEIREGTITLANGTTFVEYYMEADGNVEAGGGRTAQFHVDHTNGASSDFEDYTHGITVDPYDTNLGYTVLDLDDTQSGGRPWMAEYSDIETARTNTVANAEEYAVALHGGVQNGTVNATTYVSPSTLAQEYSTDYNSTGYYTYAVAWAGTAGFAIPDLNETSLMTIQTATDTHEGLLLSQNSPNGSVWEVGTQYSASVIPGKQFVATTDGNVTELTGEFSITSMEDENGVEVQNTTTQEFDYTTTNTTAEYAALQEEIRHLQAEILEEDPDTAPGGGSGSDGLGNLGLYGLIAAVVVAGLALASSSSGGRRRRR